MSAAVLYRWRLKPGCETAFEAAWAEGTRHIHRECGSYGAVLHRGEDGLYWSYAAWPSDEVRKTCFADHDWFSGGCFTTMQACIEERFEEIRLDVSHNALTERGPACTVSTLTTDRLLLRPLVLDDAAALYPALSDETTMQYWSRGPLESVEAVRDYLRGSIGSAAVRAWAITLPGDPKDALGWVVLIDHKPGIAETGYIIRPDARRKGYVREAVSRVLDYAFGEQGLRRDFADTDPDNAGSIAVATGLGFTLEGRLRGQWETHIGVRDSLIFGLLCAEWGGRPRP